MATNRPEFWEAVLSCPEIDSETYRRALIVNGPADPKWTRDVAMETEIAWYMAKYYPSFDDEKERI